MSENNDSKKQFGQPFNLSAHVPPPPPARPSGAPNAMPSLSDIKKPELRNVDALKAAPPRAVPAPPSRPITDNTPIRPQAVTPTQANTMPLSQPVRPLSSVPEVTMQIKPAPVHVPQNPLIQPTQTAPSQHEMPKKIEQHSAISPTIQPTRPTFVQSIQGHNGAIYDIQLPLIEQPDVAKPASPVVKQHTEQAVAATSLHVPMLQTIATSPITPQQAVPAVAIVPPPPVRPVAAPPSPALRSDAAPAPIFAASLPTKAQSAASTMADSLHSKPVTTALSPNVQNSVASQQASNPPLHEQADRVVKSMSTIAPPPPLPIKPALAKTDVPPTPSQPAARGAMPSVDTLTSELRSKLADVEEIQDKALDMLEDAKETALSKGKGLFKSLLKKDKQVKERDAAPLPETSLKSSLLASLESEVSQKPKPATIMNSAPVIQQQQVIQPAPVQPAPQQPIAAPPVYVPPAPVAAQYDEPAGQPEPHHAAAREEQGASYQQPAHHEEVHNQEVHQEHVQPQAELAPLSSEEKEAMARASLPPLPAVPKKLPKRGQSQMQPEATAESYTESHDDTHDSLHQPINYDQYQQPVQHYQPVDGAILPHLLTEILRQHKIWLDSEGREGKRANLYGEDLRHADLRGADLRSVNMRGAMLDNLDVSGANFEDADLAEASLRYVHAPKGLFQRANFTGADCEGAVLDGADLSYAEALGSNFSNAHLQGAMMQGANLRDANLAQANMSYAYLTGAFCRGVNVSHTLFNHADLMDAELREAYCFQTQFVNTNLFGTIFKDAHFEDMSFAESDFSHAHDVPIHYQNAGVQQEKVSLQEEKEALKKLESELKKKQAEVTQMKLKMQEQHHMVSSLVADEQRYVSALMTLSKRMKIVSIIWFAILAITILATVITVASIPMDELNMFELSILVIVPLLIFILCLFSAGLVNSARNKISTHATVRDHKIVDLDKNQ